MKPAPYTLTATKAGIGIAALPGLSLAVGQELPIDFTLSQAGAQENVTVTAVAPILDVSGAHLGASVSEREVQGLPVNGRQMSQLMLQAPGSQNAGTGTGVTSASPAAPSSRTSSSDGVEGSGIIDSAPGVANGENASLFKLQASLENVQEFRVESSGYPPEFGPAPADRSASSPSRAAIRSTGRSSSTCGTMPSTPPTISTHSATPMAASSRKPAAHPRFPSRRSSSISLAVRSVGRS